MSCEKWEESIYLYDELTEEERMQLDMHLQQCAKCNMLFQRVQQMQVAIKESSGNKALVRDSVVLTNKIMRSLPSGTVSGKRLTNVFTALIDSLFTRYVLGAVSLMLIFFFVDEQQRKISTPKQEIVSSKSKANVTLDTKVFMKSITQEKPVENSLYLCLKSNQCDYGIVKMYKQKKNHENI